jgi:hypothetical protein
MFRTDATIEDLAELEAGAGPSYFAITSMATGMLCGGMQVSLLHA